MVLNPSQEDECGLESPSYKNLKKSLESIFKTGNRIIQQGKGNNFYRLGVIPARMVPQRYGVTYFDKYFQKEKN